MSVYPDAQSSRAADTPPVSDACWGCRRAGPSLPCGTADMGPDRLPAPIKTHPLFRSGSVFLQQGRCQHQPAGGAVERRFFTVENKEFSERSRGGRGQGVPSHSAHFRDVRFDLWRFLRFQGHLRVSSVCVLSDL